MSKLENKNEFKLEDYKTQSLTEQEMLLLNILVNYPEIKTNEDLAKIFDVTPMTIGKWRNKPTFVAELKRYKMGVLEYIESQKKELAMNLVRLGLSAKNEMVQFNACKFLLNRDVNGEAADGSDDTFELDGWNNADNS